MTFWPDWKFVCFKEGGHWSSGFLFPIFQFRFNLSVFIEAYFFFQMVETVCAKFVSKKIRKVRWQRPAAFGRPNPEYFVAGSWDDEVSYNCLNSIYEIINFQHSLTYSKMRCPCGILYQQMNRIMIQFRCPLFLFQVMWMTFR